MRNKKNRVVSLAMSAALMLTNMISPISAFAEDVSEPMTDAYMDAPADDAPKETPETEPPYYSITLPWQDPSAKTGIWEMDDPTHAQRGGGSQWRQLSEGRTNSV